MKRAHLMVGGPVDRIVDEFEGQYMVPVAAADYGDAVPFRTITYYPHTVAFGPHQRYRIACETVTPGPAVLKDAAFALLALAPADLGRVRA